MIGQIWNRLQLMFAQSVVNIVGKENLQVTILDGETLKNIKRVEPYGLSYMPLPGCQGYIAFPSGDRSYGVALVVGDKRYQLDLAPGEVGLHDHQGNHVWIKQDSTIELKAAKVKVLAEETDIEGVLKNNGVVVGTPHAHQCPDGVTSGVIG